MGLKPLEVDDVDIATIARCQNAAIVEPYGSGCCLTLSMNQELELDAAVFSIAAPMRQQGGGEAAVAYGADMGAAIQRAIVKQR